jgi:hypothetical protein
MCKLTDIADFSGLPAVAPVHLIAVHFQGRCGKKREAKKYIMLSISKMITHIL